MGKLLMKILYTILCFTAVTLCSAQTLYVTNNWNDAKIQELYYATDNAKPIAHKTTVSFRHDGKNLLIRAVMNVKKDYPFPAITNRDGKWPSVENIEIFIVYIGATVTDLLQSLKQIGFCSKQSKSFSSSSSITVVLPQT